MNKQPGDRQGPSTLVSRPGSRWWVWLLPVLTGLLLATLLVAFYSGWVDQYHTVEPAWGISFVLLAFLFGTAPGFGLVILTRGHKTAIPGWVRILLLLLGIVVWLSCCLSGGFLIDLQTSGI